MYGSSQEDFQIQVELIYCHDFDFQAGEDIGATAVREVEEETGVSHVMTRG